jgi:hypothetical protein
LDGVAHEVRKTVDRNGKLDQRGGTILVSDAFRNQEVAVHTFATYAQLASIDGSSLRAPDGEQDDRADAFALACAARASGCGSWTPMVTDRRYRVLLAPENVPEGVFLLTEYLEW